MNFQNMLQGEQKYVNLWAIMDHEHRPDNSEQPTVFPLLWMLSIGDASF